METPPNTPAAPEAAPAPAAPESTGIPAPAPAAPAQPATNPAPAAPAPPQYTPEQISTFQRSHEQYQGNRPLLAPLLQANIKTPDQVNQLLQVNQLAADRGVDLNALLSALGTDTNTPATPEAITLDSIKGVIDSSIESTMTLRDANAQDQSLNDLSTASLETAKSEIATSIGLTAADPVLGSIVDKLADARQKQSFYPAGHPLADKVYKPLDATEIAAVKADALAQLTAFRGEKAIADAQAVINAAAAQPDGDGLHTPAGTPARAFNPLESPTADDRAEAVAILNGALGGVVPSAV